LTKHPPAWSGHFDKIGAEQSETIYLGKAPVFRRFSENQSFRSVCGKWERRRETVSRDPRPRNGSGKDSRGKQTWRV